MPRVGDLVVFESPKYPHLLLVKRIVNNLKTGEKVLVNEDNFEVMFKVAQEEGKQIFMRNDSIFINGQPDSIVELSQPYYYMLGDNRNNSADSRFFGYVPYSSVVGRLNLVFFSLNTDRRFIDIVRWDRTLKVIK